MTIDRLIRIFAGTFILLSLALGVEGSPVFMSQWWLAFTAFVGANLLQSGLTKWCLMETLLRKLIAKAPDYHHAYNALGYSLADRGIRLPEARQLIQKALEFAPADPFIVDSLAWVEFRSGNRDEALRLRLPLKQAVVACQPQVPGRTALHRILPRPNCVAVLRVSAFTAAFDAL